MLFGYPIAATEDNWLHDSVASAIRTIHAAIDANETYPGWPEVLPETRRRALRRKTGLRDRLEAYDVAVRELSKAERDELLDALETGNQIADLLAGHSETRTLDQLPQSVREPIAELFGFAFALLTDLGIRDVQYATIYAADAHRVCAFCGVEPFDAPGAPREAFDHYLTRSRYAFAAANLRNLVPMGHKCNSSYKLAVDLLRDAAGGRRVAFDPYNHGTLGVVLDESDPFGGTTDHTPRWEIRFEPDAPAVTTWDQVFVVRERYKRDHLDPSFRQWLDLFVKWARARGVDPTSEAEVIDALRIIEEGFGDAGIPDRAFLKAAVFRMLRRHCEAGHHRLLEQLKMLITPPVDADQV